MYKYDKAACAKHLAAKEGVSISYCESTIEARNKHARKCSLRRRGDMAYGKQANYGPPDRHCHFNNSTSRDELEPQKKCPKVSLTSTSSDLEMECTESSP